MTDKPEVRLKETVLKVEKDFSLSSGGFDYASWHPWEEGVTLDGHFSAIELRAIADHMDRHSQIEERKADEK